MIVLDLDNSPTGFPSQREDDPLIALVLPEVQSFAFAEERRLFYVAVTRARFGAYLVTHPLNPSVFVQELLEADPQLPRLGEALADAAAPCPQCGSGRLVISGTGKTLRCVNHPFCDYLAQACTRCEGGFAIVRAGRAECTTSDCAGPKVCSRCRVGTLVTRMGPRGAFVGCTGFSAIPPCSFTRNS